MPRKRHQAPGSHYQSVLGECFSQYVPNPNFIKLSPAHLLSGTVVMGGSTNAVLHFLAIAHSADIDLTLDDFQRVSDKTPMLADLKPSGRYVVADLMEIGGFPSILKFLIHAGMINGDIPTVTGKTLRENVDSAPVLMDLQQDMIRPLSNPIKESGHIRILRGNLATGGAVAKITGKEGRLFTGKARVFNREEDLIETLEKREIDPEENVVLCVRYEGPVGGPGMVRTSYSLLLRCQLSFGLRWRRKRCMPHTCGGNFDDRSFVDAAVSRFSLGNRVILP